MIGTNLHALADIYITLEEYLQSKAIFTVRILPNFYIMRSFIVKCYLKCIKKK